MTQISAGTFKRAMQAFALGGTILIAGCTTAQEPSGSPLGGYNKPVPGKSAYADYLIGQFAARHNHMEDAANYLSAVKESKAFPKEMEAFLKRQLFAILAGEGRIAEAATLHDEAAQNDLLGRVVRLVEAAQKNDNAAAVKIAQDFQTKGLEQFFRPLLYAWSLASAGQMDQALDYMNEARKAQGLEALFGMHYAMLQDVAGNDKEADAAYQSLLQGGQQSPSLRMIQIYGQFLNRTGRNQEALKLYLKFQQDNPRSMFIQSIIDHHPDNPAPNDKLTAKEGLAEAMFSLGSSLKGENTRQTGLIMARLALRLKPDFPLAKILVAEILEADHRLEDSNKIYATFKPGMPFSWPAQMRLALNLDDLGQTEAAIDVLNQMRKERPERLQVAITLGDILRHDEQFERASKIYADVIKTLGDQVGPHHWNLFYSRGIVLERMKKWNEAEPLFMKALELYPNQPYVLNYLGYSWIEMGLHIEKARKMIELAVEQRPRDGFIVDSLGWVLYKMKEFDAAVPHLERAVSLQPSDPVINDHLGDAYWQVGRFREARFQWNRAKSLEPNAELLEQLENKINSGLVAQED